MLNATLCRAKLQNTGLAKSVTEKPTFNKAALEKVIEQYTRESGVRQLEKQIDKALRKMAYLKALNGELPFTKISPAEIRRNCWENRLIIATYIKVTTMQAW